MTGTVEDIRRFSLPIGGRQTAGADTFEVRDKYLGSVAYEVAGATTDDVTAAVLAASDAVGSPLPAHRRYEILMGAAALLEDRADTFVDTLVVEAGKPHKVSVNEVRRSVETLRWSAEEAKRIRGETIPLDAATSGVGRLAITLREPVGVVVAITPSNSPLNLVAHKVGPAIAGGNGVVLKPPQATPISSLLLQELFIEAGLPAELFSVVAGPGIAEALLEDPNVDFYNFTGSVAVGRHIRQTVGLRDTLLELGGNSPVIVHSDADVDRAARACATKGFTAAGQACTSVQRIYVHEMVADRFEERLIDEVESLIVGDPRRPDTDVGPMIAEREAERIDAWIDEALDRGARSLTRRRRQGSVVWPTVLVDVPRDARAYCDEVFGPVVVVERYEELQAAIDAANQSPYGLHAAVFTSSLETAFDAIRQLEAGGVLVNEATQWRTEFVPFGGIKSSGSGREGPAYAIERMTRLKLAMLALEERR